ncbi:hypothetical protein F5H01DRAFT_177661 [Linnemannia elongata]|nr:hypothetical protein F5H01DRAFT_177661 [Linnemannia elongata]
MSAPPSFCFTLLYFPTTMVPHVLVLFAFCVPLSLDIFLSCCCKSCLLNFYRLVNPFIFCLCSPSKLSQPPRQQQQKGENKRAGKMIVKNIPGCLSDGRRSVGWMGVK